MLNRLLTNILNKKLILLFFGILCYPLLAMSQTAEERAKIKSQYDTVAFNALKTNLEQEQNEREKRIALYLEKNKGQQRQFTKNGVSYSIYDIGNDGKPMYQTTKQSTKTKKRSKKTAQKEKN